MSKMNNAANDEDEDDDEIWDRIDWKSLFPEEVQELEVRSQRIRDNHAKIAASIKYLNEQLDIKPAIAEASTSADVAEADDDDVIVVWDNLELFKNKIDKDSRVFVKEGQWFVGKVVSMDFVHFKEVFEVILDITPPRTIQAAENHIAFFDPPTDPKTDIGTRVLAYNQATFRWSAGVIGEYPLGKNRKRFLIFFDDGSVQYCVIERLRIIYKQEDPVWDDIEDQQVSSFVKYYLDIFPNIPIVQTSIGGRLKMQRRNRMVPVQVKEIDASLMLVDHLSTTTGILPPSEWVYSGSRKLELIQKKIGEDAHTENEKKATARFSTGSSCKRSYVVYNVIQDDDDAPTTELIDLDPEEPGVSQKSTEVNNSQLVNQGPEESTDNNDNTNTTGNNETFDAVAGHLVSTSELLALSPISNRIRKKDGQSHLCTSECLMSPIDDDGPFINPLSVPMKHGWERNFKARQYVAKRQVVYTSPCGLSLDSMEEVDACLHDSDSPLTIEQFSMDSALDVVLEYVVSEKFREIKDYSGGREKVPILCVNSIDDSVPPFLEYTTSRVPGVDVHIETHTDFLAGCSCTDGCRDPSKCECIQFTLSEGEKMPAEKNSRVGYQYRRLTKPMTAGIYECNANCKCDYRCQNRVVQGGLKLKLQIFKTVKKGWGLRCLNDIPAGQFVCHYTGQVLKDVGGDGELVLDEYLADLDYIEIQETKKEGVEVGPVMDSDNCPLNETDNSDKDSSFRPVYFATKTSRKRKKGKKNGKSGKKNIGKKSVNPEMENSEASSVDKENVVEAAEVGAGPSASTSSCTAIARLEAPKNNARKKLGGRRDKSPIKSLSESVKFLSMVKSASKEFQSRLNFREMMGDKNMYTIDTNSVGNLGRYINHSCSPNMMVQNVFIDTHDLRFPWVGFFTTKLIKAGIELTWDYGYEVGSVKGKNILCHCGTSNCGGRLL